jgi:VIT1/CCC1 family predicted Fe2+/Mn2+ transporter
MSRRSDALTRHRPDLAPGRPDHHHRDIQGGTARAAMFGISDGLVSNVSIILGVAGAQSTGGFVRLAGLAGLISGAVSMAAGEYVSMQAQVELFERELDVERRALERRPHVEQVELAHIYETRGVDPDVARELASHMMRDPELALETHAREELGIDPNALGSPIGAAIWSFVAFSLGAFVPLVPWLFTDGGGATVASVVVGAIAAVFVGMLLARFTDRPRWRSAIRQLLIATVAAGVTYAVGSAVGVSV